MFPILWIAAWANHSFVQDSTDLVHCCFEVYPPFQEMKCGLWMTAIGDLAYKITSFKRKQKI